MRLQVTFISGAVFVRDDFSGRSIPNAKRSLVRFARKWFSEDTAIASWFIVEDYNWDIDSDDLLEVLNEYSDSQLAAIIERHYDGGMYQFILDGE